MAGPTQKKGTQNVKVGKPPRGPKPIVRSQKDAAAVRAGRKRFEEDHGTSDRRRATGQPGPKRGAAGPPDVSRGRPTRPQTIVSGKKRAPGDARLVGWGRNDQPGDAKPRSSGMPKPPKKRTGPR